MPKSRAHKPGPNSVAAMQRIFDPQRSTNYERVVARKFVNEHEFADLLHAAIMQDNEVRDYEEEWN